VSVVTKISRIYFSWV